MKTWATALLAATAVAFAIPAQAQQNTNVRGTVTGFDGKLISIKSRQGADVEVGLPENVNASITQAFTLADIKPGMVLGVTTLKGVDGGLYAIDVRPIPPTANLGLSPFDLQPGSTMTNAVIEGAVASSNGQELTLNYKTGAVKVLVPPGTPMSRAAPVNRSDIKPGETIFVVARKDEAGKLVAVRVQVSKDGIRPTQ